MSGTLVSDAWCLRCRTTNAQSNVITFPRWRRRSENNQTVLEKLFWSWVVDVFTTLFVMPSIYIYSHSTGFFKGTDALIYVVDSSDSRRMKETGDELNQLLKEEKLEGVPLLVLANKQDLLNALSADEIRDGLELDRIQQRKWTIQTCSSKSGEGLDDGFQWVMANMRQKWKKYHEGGNCGGKVLIRGALLCVYHMSYNGENRTLPPSKRSFRIAKALPMLKLSK